jgi:hypothetical protein
MMERFTVNVHDEFGHAHHNAPKSSDVIQQVGATSTVLASINSTTANFCILLKKHKKNLKKKYHLINTFHNSHINYKISSLQKAQTMLETLLHRSVCCKGMQTASEQCDNNMHFACTAHACHFSTVFDSRPTRYMSNMLEDVGYVYSGREHSKRRPSNVISCPLSSQFSLSQQTTISPYNSRLRSRCDVEILNSRPSIREATLRLFGFVVPGSSKLRISLYRREICCRGLCPFLTSLLIDFKWFSNGKAEMLSSAPYFLQSSAR